ncbi:MAG: hypothetical protein DRI77_06570 [Chloroflexi bacterium]|nr:MAG: hypothetical protein DRI77_06570 [Chloroflexota bacterium]
MDTITLTLSPEVHQRLEKKAKQVGQSPETVAQELLTGQLSPQAGETGRVLREASLSVGNRSYIHPVPVVRPHTETEREKLSRLLREAGMMSEIGPHMRRLVETIPADRDKVVAILSRAGGEPLSEIVLEQRGPKE